MGDSWRFLEGAAARLDWRKQRGEVVLYGERQGVWGGHGDVPQMYEGVRPVLGLLDV